MEKIKLRSAGKGNLRSSFSFEKSWEAIDAVNEMVGKLGLNEAPNLKDFICRKKGPPGPKFGIEEVEDEIYNMRNENYSVDVFVGKAKIFLVVNSVADRQKEVSETVFEFADFEEEVNGKD